MGFMDSLFEKNVANSTECRTWQQVEESHKTLESEIGIKMKDLGGMLIFLASGLSASLLVFIIEKILHGCMGHCNKVVIIFLKKPHYSHAD